MDDELARYVEKRLATLSGRYRREYDWIEAHETLTPEEKDARKADLWVRINDRKDELKRLQKAIR